MNEPARVLVLVLDLTLY